MTQAQLEGMVSGGRLDSFSRVRHQTWSKWKWAEDLYPQLVRSDTPASIGEGAPREAAVEPPPAVPGAESATPELRLATCPDCGKRVSRRASQCPHCGCPAHALAEQPAAPQAAVSGGPAAPGEPPVESEPGRKPGILRSKWGIVSAVGSAAVLLVIAVAGLGAGWWLWKSHRSLSEQQDQAQALLEQLTVPPAPPPAPPEVSSDEIEAAMQQAAAEAAKRLDAEFRTAHSAKKLIDQTQLSVDLIQALAQGDLDAIPDSIPAEPAPQDATSYRSLYDSLYRECLASLRENVSREEFTEQAVRDAARRWEEEKRAVLEKQLTEELQKHLAPSR